MEMDDSPQKVMDLSPEFSATSKSNSPKQENDFSRIQDVELTPRTPTNGRPDLATSSESEAESVDDMTGTPSAEHMPESLTTADVTADSGTRTPTPEATPEPQNDNWKRRLHGAYGASPTLYLSGSIRNATFHEKRHIKKHGSTQRGNFPLGVSSIEPRDDSDFEAYPAKRKRLSAAARTMRSFELEPVKRHSVTAMLRTPDVPDSPIPDADALPRSSTLMLPGSIRKHASPQQRMAIGLQSKSGRYLHTPAYNTNQESSEATAASTRILDASGVDYFNTSAIATVDPSAWMKTRQSSINSTQV